jgi:hypothetical protein
MREERFGDPPATKGVIVSPVPSNCRGGAYLGMWTVRAMVLMQHRAGRLH